MCACNPELRGNSKITRTACALLSAFCLFGIDCAVCSQGYTEALSYTCNECSNRGGGIVVAVLLVIAALFVAVAVVSYVMSGERGGGGRGLVERVARYIPLQPVKIVIVSWQILTQVRAMGDRLFLDEPRVPGTNLLWFEVVALSKGCTTSIFDIV